MAIVACALALALCGCASKTISGDVKQVVNDSQGVAVDATVDVEVTGTVDAADKVDDGALVVLKDGSSYEYEVCCDFGHSSDIEGISKGDRVTIRGRLDPKYVYDNDVWVRGCTVKK